MDDNLPVWGEPAAWEEPTPAGARTWRDPADPDEGDADGYDDGYDDGEGYDDEPAEPRELRAERLGESQRKALFAAIAVVLVVLVAYAMTRGREAVPAPAPPAPVVTGTAAPAVLVPSAIPPAPPTGPVPVPGADTDDEFTPTGLSAADTQASSDAAEAAALAWAQQTAGESPAARTARLAAVFTAPGKTPPPFVLNPDNPVLPAGAKIRPETGFIEDAGVTDNGIAYVVAVQLVVSGVKNASGQPVVYRINSPLRVVVAKAGPAWRAVALDPTP